MSFVAPNSWFTNGTQLQNAVTPVYPIPSGKTIWFCELGDKLSTRNARLSNHVGSAAQMSFAVNQDALEDPTLREILLKSLLGGYCATTNKKVKPWQHPFLPGLYAKDIVECVSLEQNPSSPQKVWSNYNLCKLTLSFESLNYPVDQAYSISGAYNPNWIEWRGKAGSNRVSIPTGWYEFNSGAYDGYPATFGAWTTAPYTQIECTIYCVKRSLFMGSDALNQIPLGASNVGLVNQLPFVGKPAESLLLDSIEYQPYTDYLGNQLFNVRLNLIYNEWTWNKQPDPSGSVEGIEYVVGGSKPFNTFLLGAYITSLNPM